MYQLHVLPILPSCAAGINTVKHCCLISWQNEDGSYNFNEKTLIPDTDTAVNSWYKPGETWDIVFQEIASTYEECRAECVGLYLCLNNKVLRCVQQKIYDNSILYIMPYPTVPQHTIPYHTTHTIPYHTIPYHTIPYHTIPFDTIPYHTVLVQYCFVILYCTISNHTIL